MDTAGKLGALNAATPQPCKQAEVRRSHVASSSSHLSLKPAATMTRWGELALMWNQTGTHHKSRKDSIGVIRGKSFSSRWEDHTPGVEADTHYISVLTENGKQTVLDSQVTKEPVMTQWLSAPLSYAQRGWTLVTQPAELSRRFRSLQQPGGCYIGQTQVVMN